MYVAVHYDAVMQEYGMPSNLNVLIGEDKHRWVNNTCCSLTLLNTRHRNLSDGSKKPSIKPII